MSEMVCRRSAGHFEKYVNIIYALGFAHVKFDVWSQSFAVLFDKLSRIERQSRPKYKSAVSNWFIRRTLHVPNLIIRFGTCKVQRLTGHERKKRRLGEKCRIRTADFLNICAPSSPNSYNAGISYTPRFLVELHCIFARSFNEHPNS